MAVDYWLVYGEHLRSIFARSVPFLGSIYTLRFLRLNFLTMNSGTL